MKIWMTVLTVVVVVMSAFNIFTSNSDEIVYIDTNVLIEGYKGTKTAQAEFQKKAKEMQSQVDTLLKDWQNELKNYEKERSSMTKKELGLKKQLLQNKQERINNYQQGVKKKIQEEDQKVTRNVLNEINDYIKEYGKQKGYKIILGANGSGSLLYAQDYVNITEDVLVGLNSEYLGN